jgi:hypothetical protein
MDMRLTDDVVRLIDAHEQQPPNGTHVLALTRGGKLVEAYWNSKSLFDFDAFMPYPKIPDDVKQIQSERYK